jgi:hypothetical protein
MSNIEIFNVTFHEGGVEITYCEERDVSDKVMQQRTIAVPVEMAGDALSEVLEELGEIVDTAQAYLLNQERRTSDLFARMKGHAEPR